MHWLALALQPDVRPQAHDTPEAPTDERTARIWWALRFTPWVALVTFATPADATHELLVLEVSGSERLFGGRAALVAQIFEANMPLALSQYAQGATSLVAIGRFLQGRNRRARVQPETQAHALPDMPPDALLVQVLAAASPHLPTLARLGVRTWGQLRALPRGGLVRRFGAPLVDALDRAYGLAPEVYAWRTLPEVFDAPLELLASVDTAPALLFGARRLLAQLLVWLRARQRGVLALELLWELDARRANTRHVDAHHDGSHTGRLVLRTAQATQDIGHLQRLLGEQLARVTLPAPVLQLRLRTLQTQPMAGESHSLLPDDQRTGDSLHQTLERLAARLGTHRVCRAELLADHTPERMQRWVPCDATGKASHLAPLSPNAALLPGWLLPEPLPLAVQAQQPCYYGALELLAGPQRLEGGWLEGQAVLRDYFLARSPGAGLVWIYADRMQGGVQNGVQGSGMTQEHHAAGSGWFLHGLFG